MSETLLSVIQTLMVFAVLGIFPFFSIITDNCPAREAKAVACYPVLVFMKLRKSYNRVGSAILTVVSLLVYPTALSGVAIYGITVGIVRAFNWAFKNRE